MMKKIMVFALALCFGARAAQAAGNANVNMTVTISNTLAIAANVGGINFLGGTGAGGAFNLGDNMVLITSPIAVTNQNTSVIADLSLSATNFGGDTVGEAALLASTLVNDATVQGQDSVALGAVFVSPGMRALSTADVTRGGSGTDAVTAAGAEAKGGAATCDNTKKYCAETDAIYATQSSGGTYYLGDGQNLSLGETVSLRLFFRPPTSMTFDSVSLTATLFIVASVGGSEE